MFDIPSQETFQHHFTQLINQLLFEQEEIQFKNFTLIERIQYMIETYTTKQCLAKQQQQLKKCQQSHLEKINIICKSLQQIPMHNVYLFLEHIQNIQQEIKKQRLDLEALIINLKAFQISYILQQLEKLQKEIELQINQFNIVEDRYSSELLKNLQNFAYKYSSQQFKFEQVEQCSLFQKQYCFVIAFNSSDSIIAAGCQSKIKIFQFESEQLNEIETLSKHLDNVIQIQFMKRSNNFLSGSYDKTIIVWKSYQDQHWDCIQILDKHQGWIRAIVLNQNEDTFFSGSCDKTIRIWKKTEIWKNTNIWISSQVIQEYREEIWSLCLNEKQDKLIVCGRDNKIFVIEFNSQQQLWIITEIINVQSWGCRVCFLYDNVFLYQPYYSQKLEIYGNDQEKNKKYEKLNEIILYQKQQGSALFPLTYIKSKSIIVNKTQKEVNIIWMINNNLFKSEYQIQFNNDWVHGTISNKGKYFASWNDGNKKIEIRKFIENIY